MSITIFCLVTVTLLPIALAQSCPEVGISGDYSYDPDSGIGPEDWGDTYPICGTGNSQSPINILTSGSSSLSSAPETNYNVAQMELKGKVENWALECKSPGTCGSITYDGVTYDVFNLHFHTPSEHEIDGMQYDLEAHIVHLNGNNIRVLGFLFKVMPGSVGFPSLIINKICDGSKTLAVPLGLLVDTTEGICTYSGSLTTPPCSEGVVFFIQRKILSITQSQLNKFIQTFNSPVDTNNRPIQPLNGRTISCSS